MKRYSLSRLSDETLTRDLAAAVAQESAATTVVLAHIAEFDARKLYLPAGYPSMFAYCVDHLHLSEDAAYKRIKAARAARRFPAIFPAVDEGRLHLSGVVLLAPYLTEHTGDELLAACTHKTKAQIELFLAHRFPRPDAPTWVETMSTAPSTPWTAQQAPGPVETLSSLVPTVASESEGQVPVLVPAAPTPDRPQPAPGLAATPLADTPARDRVEPLSPGRFGVGFTVSQGVLG